MAFLRQGHPAALHSTPTIGREARGSGGVYRAFMTRPCQARRPAPGGGKEFTSIQSCTSRCGFAVHTCFRRIRA